MTHSKPQVTIDLAEYNELIKKEKVGTLTEEEFLVVTTALIQTGLTTPELFRNIPATGIVLNTAVGNYRAFLSVTLDLLERKLTHFKYEKVQ